MLFGSCSGTYPSSGWARGSTRSPGSSLRSSTQPQAGLEQVGLVGGHLLEQVKPGSGARRRQHPVLVEWPDRDGGRGLEGAERGVVGQRRRGRDGGQAELGRQT